MVHAQTGLETMLDQMGFSDKERETYLTLLEHGEAKASEIADDANVSKRYVYSVSETLEERGFVEVKNHVVPTTIRAKPPQEVKETLAACIDTIHSEIENRYNQPKQSEDHIEVNKAKATVLKRMARLIGDAQTDIMLSIPQAYLPELADELENAFNRGVLVLLVVSNVERPPQLDGLATVARTTENRMPAILNVDYESGVFAPHKMLSRVDTDCQGITFTQKQLGPAIGGAFFGTYWPPGEQYYIAEPRRLPAAYPSFRHAAIHATIHRRAGTDLCVHVTGNRTDEDGESVDLWGTVEDIKQGIIKPTSNDFPGEHALLLNTDEGVVSVGGFGAFAEDIEAKQVRLERA